MATSDRPSGLTALAVVNFLYSAMVFFANAIGLLAFKIATARFGAPDAEEDARAAAQAGLSWSAVALLSGLALVIALLLLLSGIGYLRRRRFLGRWLGTAYALVALVNAGALIAIYPPDLLASISIALVRSLFYPVFTLALVNVVFRKDLVR